MLPASLEVNSPRRIKSGFSPGFSSAWYSTEVQQEVSTAVFMHFFPLEVLQCLRAEPPPLTFYTARVSPLSSNRFFLQQAHQLWDHYLSIRFDQRVTWDEHIHIGFVSPRSQAQNKEKSHVFHLKGWRPASEVMMNRVKLKAREHGVLEGNHSLLTHQCYLLPLQFSPLLTSFCSCEHIILL